MAHKSHQTTYDELQAVAKDLRSTRERVAALEYQLSEVIGCVDEYVDMPCHSLRARMKAAIVRARRVLSPTSTG